MDSLVSVPAMVFSHFSIPAPARGQAGLGFLDLLYCGAHIAREIAISGDSAATSSRRVSALKFTSFDCRRFGENGRILVRSFGSTICEEENEHEI